MRSNLLSLQNISRQVSSTQNKLATGNKVNSAIDNPSSYYTARSLNNRANDLDALLDSMGQAVSTIKAATTALETGATFLEQAAAVATSALETAVPPKSYFEEKAGENGAVVTTAQELKDAVNSGKETIVVYGQIDYVDDIPLTLHDNQKLVGTEYFTGYTGTKRFSSITTNLITFLRAGNGSVISDLDMHKNYDRLEGTVIIVNGVTDVVLNNLSVSATQSDYLIKLTDAGNVKLTGHIAFSQHDKVNHSLWSYNYADAQYNANLEVEAEVVTNLADIVFMVRGDNAGGNRAVIKSGSIIASTNNRLLAVGVGNNTMIIERGVAFENDISRWTSTDQIDFKPTSNIYHTYYQWSNLQEDSRYVQTQAYKKANQSQDKSDEQYQSILQQYDSIIKDSTYKGVNLLKNEKLNVRFNENGSADLNVAGKDMSSNSLGLSTVEWGNQGDIAQSLQEIASALKSIRAFTAELGNNYSIITNRQEFTENLINILTEGADKLTLADMNEESANMLSLQTRQQLAINSLSLASQASQAVLKLF